MALNFGTSPSRRQRDPMHVRSFHFRYVRCDGRRCKLVLLCVFVHYVVFDLARDGGNYTNKVFAKPNTHTSMHTSSSSSSRSHTHTAAYRTTRKTRRIKINKTTEYTKPFFMLKLCFTNCRWVCMSARRSIYFLLALAFRCCCFFSCILGLCVP